MTSSPISTTSSPGASPGSSLGLPDIALIGKAGSGKSTAADLLCNLGVLVGSDRVCRWQRLSFAGPLKLVATGLWGKEAQTDRHKLQALGMAVRDIDPDTWVNLALKSYDDYRDDYRAANPAVIDDCRFENEVAALQGKGFVTVRIVADRAVRVDRLRQNGKLQDEAQLDHPSETQLDNFTADYTIQNDGSTMDLYRELVEGVVIKEARR